MCQTEGNADFFLLPFKAEAILELQRWWMKKKIIDDSPNEFFIQPRTVWMTNDSIWFFISLS